MTFHLHIKGEKDKVGKEFKKLQVDKGFSTYEETLEYLLKKVGRIKAEVIPIHGENK